MVKLYIDTHNNTSLALFKDNEIISFKENEDVRQSTKIMPLIEKMFNESNINISEIKEIIVVNGPGSFTGVRLGVTIAKTISYLLNIPIKCLNSLEAMAVMDDFANPYYGIKDAKGMYIGKNVDKKIIELKYYATNDIFTSKIVTDVTKNYLNIFTYSSKLDSINPHFVNPLYIKKIEAQK